MKTIGLALMALSLSGCAVIERYPAASTFVATVVVYSLATNSSSGSVEKKGCEVIKTPEGELLCVFRGE